MRAPVVLVVGLLLGGVGACVESSAVICEGGTVCPANRVCDERHGRCVLDAQLETCVGLPDRTPCAITGAASGLCVDEVCLEAGCGDGLVSAPEECEPGILPATDCLELGYYQPGPLACTERCVYDTSACRTECGDEVLDPLEQCDGPALGAAADCVDLGYYEPAPLTCNAVCQYDVTGCRGRCGDGIHDAPELCDRDLPAGTCVTYGFDAGPLGCTSFCSPGFEACGTFGWRPMASPTAAGIVDLWGSSARDVFGVGITVTGNAGFVVHFDGVAWGIATLPTGGLSGISGTSATDVFAVGAGGTILHHDGQAWTAQPSGVTASLHDVHALAPDDVYAVGGGGTILHYDGVAWTPQSTPAADTVRRVWARAANDVYAGTEAGALWHSTGAGWTAIASPTASSIDGLQGAATGELFVVAGGLLYRRDAAGWAQRPNLGIAAYALWVGSARAVVAVGDSGGIAFDDGARTRVLRQPDGLNSLIAAWGASPGDVFTAGYDGDILRYRGAGWTRVGALPLGGFRASWTATATDVFTAGVAGNRGALYRFDGTTWTQAATATVAADLYGVWGSSARDVFAVGAGEVLHFDGTTSTSTVLPGVTLQAVWGAGPRDVFAVSLAGAVHHFDGTGWSVQLASTGIELRDVWGSGPTDVFAVGGAGTIRHHDGATWTTMPTPTLANLRTVWGSGPTDVFAAGEDGVVLHYDGVAWTLQPSGTARVIYVVRGTAPDDVFAYGEGAEPLRHFDGERWSPVRVPPGVWDMAVVSARDVMLLGSQDLQFVGLDRERPWHCRASEAACGDALDDDCDGAVDLADPDCATAIRLAEVATGAVALVEVVNRTSAPASLDGLTVALRGSCDPVVRLRTLAIDAIVPAGGRLRVVDDPADVRAGERYLGVDSCGTAGGGRWAALCAGPCDLVTCRNVIDYVATVGAVGAPACASMTPGPFDATAATATQSVTRAVFTATGATGAAGEWALQPTTRD